MIMHTEKLLDINFAYFILKMSTLILKHHVTLPVEVSHFAMSSSITKPHMRETAAAESSHKPLQCLKVITLIKVQLKAV